VVEIATDASSTKSNVTEALRFGILGNDTNTAAVDEAVIDAELRTVSTFPLSSTKSSNPATEKEVRESVEKSWVPPSSKDTVTVIVTDDEMRNGVSVAPSPLFVILVAEGAIATIFGSGILSMTTPESLATVAPHIGHTAVTPRWQ